MSFQTALYIALAIGAVLLLVGIWLIAAGREAAPSQSVADDLIADHTEERRTTHKHFLRMLLGLDSLEQRYIRFTSRALIGFAIVGLTTVLGLGSNAYLLHRLSAVASANRTNVLEQCHDIEDLKTSIRRTLGAFGQRSAQRAFVRKRCPHIPHP